MSIGVEKGVLVRIFIGTPLTPHLQHQLKDSMRWKEERLALDKGDSPALHVISCNKKQYVGRYLPQKALALEELETIHHEINKQLSSLSPTLEGKEFKLDIFPQTFIA